MLSFLRQMAAKWSTWVGDRDMELAIRQRLSHEGFFGDSALLENIRLAAIERPGWRQVFVFQATTKKRDESKTEVRFFGVLRQDERYNQTEIGLFRSLHERNEVFSQWSNGLIRLRHAPR